MNIIMKNIFVLVLDLCIFIKQLIYDNSFLQFRFISGYVAAPCANFDPWPCWGGALLAGFSDSGDDNAATLLVPLYL